MNKVTIDTMDDLKDQIQQLQHEMGQKETIIKFQTDEIERLTQQCAENWYNWKNCQAELDDYLTLQENKNE